eukprot:TRINITY_DN3636_c0_g1_i5.p1 TRINITY_DN3636_c0_g1~~TRINITY_DN3636_c0_g1_i5.p1  ORF type:complete len:661 (-),score=146.94 TRINITY_DN3636_c0_g1_i5:148-2130(-)
MNVSSNASFPQGVIQATAGDEESQRGAGGAGHRGKGENLIQSGAGKVAGDMKGSLDRRELESVQERSVEQSEVSRADAASRDRESSLQFPRSEGLLGQSSQLVNIDKSSSIADYENLLAIEREKNLLAQPESRDSSLLQKGSPQRMFPATSAESRSSAGFLSRRPHLFREDLSPKGTLSNFFQNGGERSSRYQIHDGSSPWAERSLSNQRRYAGPPHTTKASSSTQRNLLLNISEEDTEAVGRRMSPSRLEKHPLATEQKSAAKQSEQLSLLLEEERSRVARLEERISTKDRLINQMRLYQEELYNNFRETQEELSRLKEERDSKIEGLSRQIDLLNQTILQFEERLRIESLRGSQDLERQRGSADERRREPSMTLEERDLLEQEIRFFQDQSMQLREANQELLVRYEALQKEFKEKEHSLSQAQGKILRLTGNQRVFDELRRENEAFRKPRDQKAFNSKGTENYEYGIAPQTSTQVINEVMAELEVKTYPELQQRIREIVQLNKQANKFTDAISALVADMGGVPKSRLTLKQAWKWIKRVLEDYMVLKKSLGEGGSYYGGEHSERQTMRLVEQYLRVENERAVLPRLTHLLVESEVMERIIDKIRAFFQIDHNVALNELEKILDVEYLGNHGSLLQSPPPHHHHESHYKPRAPGKSFKH